MPSRRNETHPDGVCRWCHVAPPEPDRTRCAACAAKANEAARTRRARLKAARKCLVCGAVKVVRGRQYCETHLAYYRERNAAMRAAAKDADLDEQKRRARKRAMRGRQCAAWAGAGEPRWVLSSSSDRRAIDIVDGTGPHAGKGPHYSRRSPGSKTFTGVGQEIVLVTRDGCAVWACIYQRTPSARGTGGSRGRSGVADAKPRYLWRNMMFRNLGAGLSSDLIQEATEQTYRHWVTRYGALPPERLRTEIGVKQVKSRNPGYCYERAGWERGETKNGKLFFWAPEGGR